MIFTDLDVKFIDKAAKLAMDEYSRELSVNSQLIDADFTESIKGLLGYLFDKGIGKMAFENDVLVGFMSCWAPINGFFGDVKGAFCPLGGSAFSGSDRGKLASMLYQKIAEEFLNIGVYQHGISLYAHDDEVRNSFLYNSFGVRCSDAIRRLVDRKPVELSDEFEFVEMFGEDRRKLNGLMYDLDVHLVSSPTFFPTHFDFFENWYKAEGRRVFAAKKNDKYIGVMCLDEGGETFISDTDHMLNIGSTFIDKEYRGFGVAGMLLEHVSRECEKAGYKYIGVDCETINPTALRFWAKNFSSYTYSYVRRIDERAQGYIESLKKDKEKFI